MNRGKIIIVLCVILLSIQIASADMLNLTASTNEMFADNRTVWIMANLTNTTGYPINNTRVNFTTDCGILSAGYNYTNASGIAVVNIRSWDLCTANITAQAPNAINTTVTVTFVRGPISLIILSADSSGTVNSTHLVTATVYDKTMDEFANNESRWRVMPNVTLNFNATSPLPDQWNSPDEDYNASVSPSLSTTDENGTTTVTIHLSSRAGGNYIDVNVTNEDGEGVTEYLVIVGLAGEAITLTVTASPENVSANGIDLSHVTGKVADGFGNPLLSTGAIQFNITSSAPIIKPLNSVGVATINIGPSKFIGNAVVNGTYITGAGDYTNLTDSATVIFYAEEPARVVVTADATKISTSNIPGVNISTITATVIDKWGHTLPGRTVTFSLTAGTLSSTTETTDSRGQAVITLQSDTAGDAAVTAKALNDSGYTIEGNIVIRILSDPFISVISTIEPDPIEPGGIINVTTSVAGQGNITGTRLAAHAMLTLDRSGSMDPDYYAGTPLDVALVLDRSGSMELLGTDPEQPMTDAETAAKVFMDNLVSNAQVGVIAFEGSVETKIGLTLLNSYDDKTLVRNAINSIHTGDGTAIGDGLRRANDILKVGRIDARRITILLTDGQCTAGDDRDCSQAILNANANHITIYTIGLGSAEYIDEPLLQRVASETGGRYYNAPSSSELRSVYNSIAQEISDYDITEIEYGTEGFTPHDCEAEGSLSPINTSPPYILKFAIYDLNDGNECYFKVNNNPDTWIPATGYWNWGSFEYDITALVQSGTNVIGFYDPNNWNNAIKDVEILANNITIAHYPSEVDLVKAHPYNCTFNTSYYGFEDTFLINKTINDLKVLLQWENTTIDLNLKLTSPSGHVYGAGDDTTGYYFDDREAIPIDVRSPEFDTYIASASPDAVFADEISFYVTDKLTGAGEQEYPIMRWKLPGAPTHNARIEHVTMYLRGITPTSNPDNEHRSVNIYDLTTSYSDDPTWNCNDSSTGQRWVSGGSFSSADNDSYLVDSVALSASISGQVVEFDITSANWGGSRLPDWGKECNIVLTGSGYNGTGADRFASSETNPGSHTCTLNGYRPLVTITYSIPRDTSEYIWIHPLPYTYPDTDADMVGNGNWTVQVTGSGVGSEQFNITTYIDKKSAAKLASHAFISSLDPDRADRVGLATYSYSSTNDTSSQTSYVCEGNQWEGYFTVNTQGIYYFNLSWANASDNLDMYLYDGITVLNSSATGSSPETVSATLLTGTDYRVVVNGTNVTGNDTRFTINVSSSPLRGIMCAYYDSGSVSIPRYRQWGGGAWSGEESANSVGGTIQWIVMQSCPTRKETIMGALDRSRDVNVQIWDGSAWSTPQQFSDSLDSYARRGFDIAYEQISGDAMVVYMDMGLDDGVPRYRIWNGTGWGGGASVDGTNPGTGDVWWVRLAANPNSNEMVLVTLDDWEDIRAQVWDGSSWGNPIQITNSARIDRYQCFDVVYDTGGNATVVWADQSSVKSHVWNGTAWSAASDVYSFTDNVYWIKLASDPNSDNILMGALDAADDISVSAWNGSAWTTTKLEIETASHNGDSRCFDVSFEQASSIGMVVWSDNTHIPKYRTWNATDDSWSSESSASSIGMNYVSWVQLTPDTESDEIFLMTSDGDNDINIQRWDGSSWGAVSEVETKSIRHYKCFDLTYLQQETAVIQTTVNWLEWRAKIDKSLDDSIVSFDPISTAIDALTADGMTAIDEGLCEANNALYDYFAAVSKPIENGTIILMADGIDNVGYHSMIAEAERAAANNTTIFTVGFGSTIEDKVLRQIANLTGGEYYFAPNATVLKNIFVGIAGELGNFTAPEPRIDIRVGNNATIEGAFANVTYINDSANVTYFYCTLTDCSEGYYAYERPSNPNVTYAGNRTILSWDIGNRPDRIITVGKYWNVTYQLRIDNKSAGYISIILYPSCVTYGDARGEGNCSNNLVPDANVDVVGNETNSSTKPAHSIELTNKSVSCGPPLRKPSSPQPDTVHEYAYRLTAHLKDVDGNPVAFGTVVEFKATSGTLYNDTYYNTSGLLNGTTGLGGAAIVWLSSDAPGTITVCAYHTTANGTELTPACNVVIFHSLESPPIIPPAPRPRGVITLESDPLTDWLSFLWRNR